MSDELTFNPSDNKDTPESRISFVNEIKTTEKGSNNFHPPKSNLVTEEFTFNAFDKDDTPNTPILQALDYVILSTKETK